MSNVKELQVIHGDSFDISPADPSFFKIPVDLNAGSGGEFIFLCFKKGDDNPIRGLFVLAGPSPDLSAPAGFERINVDLNAGAGGDFIFLCFTRIDVLGPPIIDISVIIGSFFDIPAPTGYTKIPVDLNKGAGGAFIFICFRQ